MTCAELELRLCDYLDGALPHQEQQSVEAHLALCTECRSLAADARGVLAFLEGVPEPEPPPLLVTRILHQIPVRGWASSGSPAKSFLSRLFEPVLQPRLVMGMAMTILSFAMLGRFAGIEARQLRPSDLSPVAIWESVEDRIHRSWARAVKYYESLKIVYEVQSRLQELTEPEAEEPAAPGQVENGVPQGRGKQ